MCTQCEVDAVPLGKATEAKMIAAREAEAKSIVSESELLEELSILAMLIGENFQASDALGRKLSPLRMESPMASGETSKDEEWKAIYGTVAGERIRSLQQMVQYNTDHVNNIKNETRI